MNNAKTINTHPALVTINDRLKKKSAALTADKTKIDNLNYQILLFQNSITKTEEALAVKTEEVDQLVEYQLEATELVKRFAELDEYTAELRAKFDKIPWREDLAWEEKIESSDYHAKTEEKFAVRDRLDEIVKLSNKIYYRR